MKRIGVDAGDRERRQAACARRPRPAPSATSSSAASWPSARTCGARSRIAWYDLRYARARARGADRLVSAAELAAGDRPRRRSRAAGSRPPKPSPRAPRSSRCATGSRCTSAGSSAHRSRSRSSSAAKQRRARSARRRTPRRCRCRGASCSVRLNGTRRVRSAERQTALAQADIALAESTKKPDWGVERVVRPAHAELLQHADACMVSVDLPMPPGDRQDRDIAAQQALARARRAQREDARRTYEAEVRGARRRLGDVGTARAALRAGAICRSRASASSSRSRRIAAAAASSPPSSKRAAPRPKRAACTARCSSAAAPGPRLSYLASEEETAMKHASARSCSPSRSRPAAAARLLVCACGTRTTPPRRRA